MQMMNREKQMDGKMYALQVIRQDYVKPQETDHLKRFSMTIHVVEVKFMQSLMT